MESNALKARLSHVKKRAEFNGYGFNLHAAKGQTGQFLGKIDPGSPAEDAGLKEGDRIIEVNGTNISNENHQQVVQRIKAVPNETTLLVVDQDADTYFKEQNIVIRGDMPGVLRLSSDSKANGEALTNGSDSHSKSDSLPENAPRPRRCHIKIWPEFQGYGFNLHAEKGKPGQFIGKVDDGSPAQAAGLREGDRIVEINEENIGLSTHQEVVAKIKFNPKETVMLVLDPDAEAYYQERNIVVSHNMPNVDRIECPDTKQAASSNGSEVQAEVVNHVDSSHGEPSPQLSRSSGREDDDQDGKEPSPQLSRSSGREDDDQDGKNNEGAIAAAAIEEAIHQAEANQMDNRTLEDEAENYEVIANVQGVKDERSDDEGRETPELPERSESPEPQVDARAETPEPRAETPEVRAETPEPARAETPEPKAETPERSPTPEVAPPVYEYAVNIVAEREQETKKEEPAVAMATAAPVQLSPASPTKGPVTIGGIEFAGSAKEARLRMEKKKRDDVKAQQMSAKAKYDLLMKM